MGEDTNVCFNKRLGEAVACDPAWRESVAKWPIKLAFKLCLYHGSVKNCMKKY
jgi:hypothetical protein